MNKPTNLQALTTPRDEYADLVIKRLEEMLAIAKERPQRGVVIHMLDREELQYRTAFTSMNVAEQLGYLEMAKHNLIAL